MSMTVEQLEAQLKKRRQARKAEAKRLYELSKRHEMFGFEFRAKVVQKGANHAQG